MCLLILTILKFYFNFNCFFLTTIYQLLYLNIIYYNLNQFKFIQLF